MKIFHSRLSVLILIMGVGAITAGGVVYAVAHNPPKPTVKISPKSSKTIAVSHPVSTPTTPTPISTIQTTPKATPEVAAPQAVATPQPDCSALIQTAEAGYYQDDEVPQLKTIVDEEVYVNTTPSDVYGMTGMISIADPTLAEEDVDGAVQGSNIALSISLSSWTEEVTSAGCSAASMSPIVLTDPSIDQILADSP